MKRPYKVRIELKYIVELDVDASNEEDAENLALEGYENYQDKILIDKEVLETNEVEYDRFAEE